MSRRGTSGSLSRGRAGLSCVLMVSESYKLRAEATSGSIRQGPGLGWLPRLAQDGDRVGVMLDHVFRDDALLDVVVGGDLVHHLEHQVLDDDLQAPRPHVAGQGF